MACILRPLFPEGACAHVVPPLAYVVHLLCTLTTNLVIVFYSISFSVWITCSTVISLSARSRGVSQVIIMSISTERRERINQRFLL